MFSNDTEYLPHTLRWVALLSGRVKCNIAASTGIHNHETIIKQLLAGADAVHLVSVFYKHHGHQFDVIPTMINGLENWMTRHNFNTISDFKGLMSKVNVHNPASYERVQFLRLFSSVE